MKTIATTCALLVMTLCAACGGTGPMPTPPDLKAKQSYYLRGSIDADPRGTGWFLPGFQPATADDNQAVKTECNQFVSVRDRAGGGVEYDEYYLASESAVAGLNLPADAPVQVGADGSRLKVYRVRYTLSNKRVAEVSDPAAFRQCCDRAAGQCAEQLIGEYLCGTGEILALDSASSKAGLSAGTGDGAAGGLEWRDGRAWRTAIRFRNAPVCFAFNPSPAMLSAKDPLLAWPPHLPTSPHRTYFEATSEWRQSQAEADKDAEGRVRSKVIAYVGETIAQRSLERRNSIGTGSDVQDQGDRREEIERASSGIAQRVRIAKYHRAKEEGPNGWRFNTTVLAFVDNQDLPGDQ